MPILENLWNTETKTKAKIINSRDNVYYFGVLHLSVSLHSIECLHIYKNYTYAHAHVNILDWDWHHFIHVSEV